ncbi:MAG: hypothetical protein AMXMBFR7_26510 [Planctomycetota bacterium]
MYEYRLAYRHHDGAVEGFTGCGFTREAAERNALNRIREKVEWLEDMRRHMDPTRDDLAIRFEESRVIRSMYPHDGKLTKVEYRQLQRDWRTRR